MRETVERPDAVIDINALPYRDIDLSRRGCGSARWRAWRTSPPHPGVRRQYPVIVEAGAVSASAQLRNMASIGGNLMQRPRCLYFRDVDGRTATSARRARAARPSAASTAACDPGHQRPCVATHPSDLAVALVALDADRCTPRRERRPADSRRGVLPLPGITPDLEHTSARRAHHRGRSADRPEMRRSRYLKVRDRQSYEFAIASAAVALDIEGGTSARRGWQSGGVATVPWRLPAVEQALTGRPRERRSCGSAAAGPCGRRREAAVGQRVQGGVGETHRGAPARDRGGRCHDEPAAAADVASANR